jgi:hypothetical protein
MAKLADSVELTLEKALGVTALSSDHIIHALPISLIRDTRLAITADATAETRWDTFKAHAALIGLTEKHLVSPNTKAAGLAGITPNDPVFLRDDEGERIVTTHGEVFADCKSMAYYFCTASERKWIDTPSKGLTDPQKLERRAATQQPNSYVAKMRKHLTPKVEQAGNSSRTRSVAVRLVAYINDAIKLIQADDEPNYAATETVTALNTALALVTKGLPVDKTDK